MKKYNDLGLEGIKNQRKTPWQHQRGKKPLLNQEQLEKLIQHLPTIPSDGGIWTEPKVASWIAKERGIEKISNQRGWDYLKKCGNEWQKPRPKHRKGCEKFPKEFKENLPLKIKQLQQKHPSAQIELWFFDEHRVGLKPILRKVCSPVGERPTAIIQHWYE